MVADLCHFLRNMDMYMEKKKEKKTLQGLWKNMQSKMIFKDNIDCLSTDVWLNNNYDMVCGVIFSPQILHIRFPHSIQYEQKKLWDDNLSLIWWGFRLFVLLAKAWNIFGIRVASLKMCTYNLWLRKFHSQGNVASLCRDTMQWDLVYLCRQVVAFQFW